MNNKVIKNNLYLQLGQNINNDICKKYHDDTIQFSLHTFPMATQYWLHMHGYVESLLTNKGYKQSFKQIVLVNLVFQEIPCSFNINQSI